MIAGMLITIREGLEAFLIVGILLGYLTKLGQFRFKRYIWGGTGAAIIASIIIALAFQALAIRFEGRWAEIFEVVVALIAIGVLTWMVLWMQRQSRRIKSELEQKVSAALSSNQAYALAGLAFISVFREGLETALFLSALLFSTKEGLLLGSALGLAAAAIAYLIFRTTISLNLRAFFLVTGVLLIFIAAGLLSHSIRALQELRALPIFIDPIWNSNNLIDEEGLLGRLLHAFIGYEATPSLLQFIGYLTYIGIFGGQFLKVVRKSGVEDKASKDKGGGRISKRMGDPVYHDCPKELGKERER